MDYNKFIPKQIYGLILFSTSLICGIVFAGTFTPSPPSPDTGPYTLSDIYNKISSSTYSYSSHTFNPAGTPNSTGFTLSDLWDIIPSHRTLTEGSLDSGILNTGIYPTTDLTTAEPNLIADNIATGTTMFGVVGRCENTNCVRSLIVSGNPSPDITGKYLYYGQFYGSGWTPDGTYIYKHETKDSYFHTAYGDYFITPASIYATNWSWWWRNGWAEYNPELENVVWHPGEAASGSFTVTYGECVPI